MGLPTPMLTYHFWTDRPDPAIVGEGPTLHDVVEVEARVRDKDVEVYVTGRMLTRANKSGPRRTVRVDLTAEQPEWMATLITEARNRLLTDPHTFIEWNVLGAAGLCMGVRGTSEQSARVTFENSSPPRTLLRRERHAFPERVDDWQEVETRER